MDSTSWNCLVLISRSTVSIKVDSNSLYFGSSTPQRSYRSLLQFFGNAKSGMSTSAALPSPSSLEYLVMAPAPFLPINVVVFKCPCQ